MPEPIYGGSSYDVSDSPNYYTPVGGGNGSYGGGNGSYGGGEDFGPDFGGGNEANVPYYNAPGVGTPVVETWGEEDIDYLDGNLVSDMTNEQVAAVTGQTYNPNTGNIESYKPPEEIYGPNQAGVIPGETAYNMQGMDYQNNPLHKGVLNTIKSLASTQSGMNTLVFYGILQLDKNTGKYVWAQGTNGGKQLPVEFMNQIAEGSIVGGYEGEISDEPYTGTWDQIESPGVYGEHPMFPGGLSDYYNATNDPFIVPYSGGVGLGGTGGYSGSGGGYGRRGGSGGGAGGGSRMQFPGAEGGNPHRPRWGQSEIQRRYINRMRGMNRGGIVSLC